MMDSKESFPKLLSNADIYKIALDTRNMEIELFWKRSNYFLILNTAVAAGFFLKASNEHQLLLSIFGFITAILWLFINAGGKFWQSRWERRLHIIEESLSLEIKLFSSCWNEINQDVKENIEFSEHTGIRKYLDNLVLKKQSVSFMMELLSIAFIILWFLLIMGLIYNNAQDIIGF